MTKSNQLDDRFISATMRDVYACANMTKTLAKPKRRGESEKDGEGMGREGGWKEGTKATERKGECDWGRGGKRVREGRRQREDDRGGERGMGEYEEKVREKGRL